MILYQLFCIQGLARGTSQTPEHLSWWRSPSGCCRPPRPTCTCNSGKGCSRSTTWDAPRTCWTCRLARLLVVGLWQTMARPRKKWYAGWEIGSPIDELSWPIMLSWPPSKCWSCVWTHAARFPQSHTSFQREAGSGRLYIGELGDFSPAIGQTALKISDRAGSCQRWLDQLPFW